MTIKSGSLLIAHPIHSADSKLDAVVLVTECHSNGIVGLRLNKPAEITMTALMMQKRIQWTGQDQVYSSGNHTPGALILLHRNDWYSRTTMPVDEQWSVSSDEFMLEKLAQNNCPSDYRICLGITLLNTQNIQHDITSTRPKWLLLEDPDPELINAPAGLQWDMAVSQCSQNLFDNYF